MTIFMIARLLRMIMTDLGWRRERRYRPVEPRVAGVAPLEQLAHQSILLHLPRAGNRRFGRVGARRAHTKHAIQTRFTMENAKDA
jgi:hypothetical protein